jgi:hypothetical protein
MVGDYIAGPSEKRSRKLIIEKVRGYVIWNSRRRQIECGLLTFECAGTVIAEQDRRSGQSGN